MTNTNKFEHLMTDNNRAELKKEGKTTITQFSSAWKRDVKVATVEHYITLSVPYAYAKKILDDKIYCYNRQITRGDYNAEDKTIVITGLYPIKNNKNIVDSGSKIIDTKYIYGM